MVCLFFYYARMRVDITTLKGSVWKMHESVQTADLATTDVAPANARNLVLLLLII